MIDKMEFEFPGYVIIVYPWFDRVVIFRKFPGLFTGMTVSEFIAMMERVAEYKRNS